MSIPADVPLSALDIVLAQTEISRLKARYFECVDGKDYAALADLFTSDAVLMVPIWSEGKALPEAMAAYESSMASVESVHTASMPVIDVTTPTSATAIWHMQDRLYTRVDGTDDRYSVMQGYGHYTEAYRRENGRWLISSLELTRTRKDSIEGVIKL